MEEEKRDSHRCSLFLQPAFWRSLSSQLLIMLSGTSGSCLVVFVRRKKPLLFIFGGFIKKWELWEEGVEHCGVSTVLWKVLNIKMKSVVLGVKSCLIYLFIPHFKAAFFCCWCLPPPPIFIKRWMWVSWGAKSLLSLFQAAAPLCSYSARLGSFSPLISFFIHIKEVAESGIPAAHFYYTWTLRCRHRRGEEEEQFLLHLAFMVMQ